jgi:hypothetical protein
MLRADDTVMPILISAVPRVIDGRNSGSIAVITDLSELKQIEQTLAAREAFENELIELSAEFVQVSLETQGQLFNYALKRIGSFCKVDRSYVFEFDPTEKTIRTPMNGLPEASLRNSRNCKNSYGRLSALDGKN